MKPTPTTWKVVRRIVFRSIGVIVGLTLLWFGGHVVEWVTGIRILPWNPYAFCGDSESGPLPDTVRVGLYEEFPNPWRLEKLNQIDFPVTLAIAARSQEEFLQQSIAIRQQYPQVREVYYWPQLAYEEGYYLGTWSDAAAIQRVAQDIDELPVLWDLEMPLNKSYISAQSWPHNRQFLDQWFSERTEKVYIWRTHTGMGLNPLFLRLLAMHYDPLDYPQVSLHLDLYTSGAGLSEQQMKNILHCGVDRYQERFIPSLGVLNDGEAAADIFVPPETLQRDLRLVREAGITEVWFFGVNGLNDAYLSAIKDTLPLETLPARAGYSTEQTILAK
ncbi:MAG: hypothetical protein GFH27_549303n154 [Chloroflexi bacterium AL-W]|nr:hypothetical protein [Chloroflexi bacterium AL-N1]NOK68039.1 hypothetical protein [Chloroflexi bacterium AL-N10]NOK73379.1 hypothetical protein [Chloroflexi bacterium AL-N5]NOK83293.1 hypothetical protein [Chloroflexi bacterium AL-W]NOK87710.1 hypothetical protein [Chloroflexi bacterium AL-N15]